MDYLMTIKPYTWVVRFDVAPLWVADGFTLSDERALEMLGADLSSANMSFELAARVLSAPSPLRIAREQGYGEQHPEAGKFAREIIDGAPHAYTYFKGVKHIDSVERAVNAAIDLLDSVAFVRDENDNTADVLAALRSARSMLRGDSPISDIDWQPAE